MNLNVDLSSVDWRKVRPSRRAAGVVVLVLLIFGALAGAWYWLNHPPRPWLVRWRLERYLARKAETGNFKAEFPFPSQAEMSRVVAPDKRGALGSRTQKDFEALREEYLDARIALVKLELQLAKGTNAALLAELQAKEQALAPILADLWEFQNKWMEDPKADASPSVALAKARREFASARARDMQGASGYPQIYKNIGQEVFVASRLLESKNFEHRRVGVSMAFDASRHALGFAQDGMAAARICEAYVLPNLDLADDNDRQSPFSTQNLLGQAADVFRSNGEWDNMARVYESYLKRATTTRQKDWANAQIAGVYQQSGDLPRALVFLRKVQNKDDYGVTRRIAQLERRVGR